MASFDQSTGMSESEVARSLLDQLFSDSKLYTQSKDYQELLDFVVRLRNVAPFNAMLLQVQKPGLSYAASARDWRERFGRSPKVGARPLLILWPFGPVAFVYDVLDTEGEELPADMASFSARGTIGGKQIASFSELLSTKGIVWRWMAAGDQRAGWIRFDKRVTAKDKKTDEVQETNLYELCVNKNHLPAVQFATLVHELGHLFLGHLGPDEKLKVPQRASLTNSQKELEAESVAYIVCARNGVASESQTYLARYVEQHTTIDDIDLYRIMDAAGAIERLLGLTAHTRFEKPKRRLRS